MPDSELKMRIERVKSAATGRWTELFLSAGAPAPSLERNNRPCPFCGGKDRFTYFRKESEGRWFCRGCGYGDGIAFLMRLRAASFYDTLLYLERALGLPDAVPTQNRSRVGQITDEEVKRTKQLSQLESIWAEAKPLAELPDTDPVIRYLQSRGFVMGRRLFSTELRSHPRLDYWETQKGDSPYIQWWPAMIARVSDESGSLVSLHRTYLTETGEKAPVSAQKKLASGSCENGLIRLFEPTEELGIAEGIETALAARALFRIPVWSAVSVGGFQNLKRIPEGVKSITVFGDNDTSFSGQAGAWTLAARLRRDYPDLQVAVEIPKKAGADWNDVMRLSRAGSRRPGKKSVD